MRGTVLARGRVSRGAGPSVREVRLIGGASKPGRWAPGDRVDWSGRAYRVETAEDSSAGAVYVHLGPWVDLGAG